METKISNSLPILFILQFLLSSACSSSLAQNIVDHHKGDHKYAKKDVMDANLAETVFFNFGMVGDWVDYPLQTGVWPKGKYQTYIDGTALIIQAEVTDHNDNVIHPLETNYYEYTRYNSENGITYGWWPLPGYANPNQSGIARSDNPNSWPASWPDRPHDLDGKWNGYFGKGITNADLETYYVCDDNEDRQYINSNQFYPDTSDTTRGGLGIQVQARGFQWNNPQLENVIFWHYNFINMGTTDYKKTLFAQYVDWAIGGHDNSSNNAADYDQVMDISYAWATDSTGLPGDWSPVGLAAYAFLESPGIDNDNIDNDMDGLTDERKDNKANVFITNPNDDPFLRNVQQDTIRFKNFYGYSWRPHWDADENANWKSYTDLNHNGKWDKGEPLNDDVGTDGISPSSPYYTGPDPDGSEGDGKPEQGEPNFGMLDKDESDQIGLTGYSIFKVRDYKLNDDENNWQVLTALPSPHNQSLEGVNIANYFSSYFFSLSGRTTYSNMTGMNQEIGETQTYSLACLFAYSKEALFNEKQSIQKIYNNNFRFDTTTGITSYHSSSPSTFSLRQNYPNPFNPTTTINYRIPKDEVVSLKVYNSIGEKVKTLIDGYQGAGLHSVKFDGSKFASGIYYYKLKAGDNIAVNKMILIK